MKVRTTALTTMRLPFTQTSYEVLGSKDIGGSVVSRCPATSIWPTLFTYRETCSPRHFIFMTLQQGAPNLFPCPCSATTVTFTWLRHPCRHLGHDAPATLCFLQAFPRLFSAVSTPLTKNTAANTRNVAVAAHTSSFPI